MELLLGLVNVEHLVRDSRQELEPIVHLERETNRMALETQCSKISLTLNITYTYLLVVSVQTKVKFTNSDS